MSEERPSRLDRTPVSQLEGEELDQAVWTEVLGREAEDRVAVIRQEIDAWSLVEQCGLVVFPLKDRWWAGDVAGLGGVDAIYIHGGLSTGDTAYEAICRAAVQQARSDR